MKQNIHVKSILENMLVAKNLYLNDPLDRLSETFSTIRNLLQNNYCCIITVGVCFIASLAKD